MWNDILHGGELSWFFQDAISEIGERSTFGAQLEAIERASRDSANHRIWSVAQCTTKVWVLRSWRVAQGFSAIGEFDEGFSAQPTLPRDRQGDGYLPNDHDLRRFAEVSRTLSRLPPECAEVLRAYYEAGDRWATGPRGKLIPVMVLTQGGRLLLAARAARLAEEREASRALLHQGHEELLPAAQVADELREQAKTADVQRRLHLTLAAKQAQTMLGQARAAYAFERPVEDVWGGMEDPEGEAA